MAWVLTFEAIVCTAYAYIHALIQPAFQLCDTWRGFQKVKDLPFKREGRVCPQW